MALEELGRRLDQSTVKVGLVAKIFETLSELGIAQALHDQKLVRERSWRAQSLILRLHEGCQLKETSRRLTEATEYYVTYGQVYTCVSTNCRKPFRVTPEVKVTRLETP